MRRAELRHPVHTAVEARQNGSLETTNMPVPKAYQADLATIVAKRHDNGDDFWSTEDGRWGTGSPFSTYDCILILTELGVPRSDPLMKGAAARILASQRPDGSFRPAPKASGFPCYTANAARVLCRAGHARDERLVRSLDRLFETIHDDHGWRCNKVRMGKSSVTDASNPGVTLYALDAFRFTKHLNADDRLDRAVATLLDHQDTRRPLGPCAFGIGSRFNQVEFPFLRYNLFLWVYVLSFYETAHDDPRFLAALESLEERLVDGQLVVEAPNRRLAGLEFCRKGAPSRAATKRYREICKNLGR